MWIVYGKDEYGEFIGPKLFKSEVNAMNEAHKIEEEMDYCVRVYCEKIGFEDKE